MKLDMLVGGGPLREMQEIARDAARVGFDGVVITEGGRTAYLSCAAVALAADLDIATGIAVAFPRSPMVTAQIAWELAETTGGRFRLGLGSQVRAHITRRYAAEFEPPGPRLREYVRAVKAIFRAFRREEPLNFEGQWWSFSLLPDQWSPGPIDYPDPKVDISAVNPWMLRMAGGFADGVHVHPLNTPTYLARTVIPEVAAGAAGQDRRPDEISLLVPAFIAVGDTDEERSGWRDLARRQVAFYGSTPNYGFIFDQIGFEGTTPRLRERQKAGDLDGMAAVITDDILDHFTVTSTWNDLAPKLIERYEGTASRVIVYTAGISWRADREAFLRWGDVTRDLKKLETPTAGS